MKGRDLRQMRINAGMKQYELRERLGWNMNKLVEIENERMLPTEEDEVLIIQTIGNYKKEPVK